jgi:hypothetical protein
MVPVLILLLASRAALSVEDSLRPAGIEGAQAADLAEPKICEE